MNKKLVITRSTWARGDNIEPNSLLNTEGMMCCLGFAGKQLCNLPDERLLDTGTPAHLGSAFTNGLSWLLEESEDGTFPSFKDSDDCQVLMDFNDDSIISDAKREETIIEIFAKHGVDVTFED